MNTRNWVGRILAIGALAFVGIHFVQRSGGKTQMLMRKLANSYRSIQERGPFQTEFLNTESHLS